MGGAYGAMVYNYSPMCCCGGGHMQMCLTMWCHRSCNIQISIFFQTSLDMYYYFINILHLRMFKLFVFIYTTKHVTIKGGKNKKKWMN